MSEISKEELLKVISVVSPAVSNQSFIPALSHIAFSEDRAEAYNDITAISVKHSFPIKGCLPADLLTKALNSFSGDDVLVTEKDGAVKIASGRSNFKMPLLALEDFPFNLSEILEEEGTASVKVTADVLKGLELCLLSVGSDPSRPAFSGVTIEQNDDGFAVLYSTNNFSISRYITTAKVKLPGGVPLIFPAEFCSLLISISKKFTNEVVGVVATASGLVAEWDSVVLFTRFVSEEEPMEFEKTIENFASMSEIKKASNPIPDSFDAAFNRALVVTSSEIDKETKVTVSGGRLSLYSKGLAEASDSMAYKVDDIEPFIIDPSLVVKALKACSSMSLLDKVMVLSSDNLKYVHLISHCAAH